MTPELSKERNALYSRKHDAKRNKERDRLRKKRPSPRDPVKVSAKGKVQSALSSGRLIRPEACNECGIPGPVQAHHEDYTKPLDVEWLCRPCHSKRHRKYR